MDIDTINNIQRPSDFIMPWRPTRVAGLLRAEMFIGKMNVGSLEMVRGHVYIKRIYFESSEVAIAFARKYEKEMLEYIDRIRAEVRIEPIVFSNEAK